MNSHCNPSSTSAEPLRFPRLPRLLLTILTLLGIMFPMMVSAHTYDVPVLGNFGIDDAITIMNTNPDLIQKNISHEIIDRESRSVKIFPTNDLKSMEYAPSFILPANNNLLVLSYEPVEGDPELSRAMWHSSTTRVIHTAKQILLRSFNKKLVRTTTQSRIMNARMWSPNGNTLQDTIIHDTTVQSAISSSSSVSDIPFMNKLDTVPNPEIVYTAPSMGLVVISVHDALVDNLPSMVPGNTRVHWVDMTPKPGRADDSISSARHAITHLRNIYTRMDDPDAELDPNIISLIDKINQTDIQSTVQYLTGEDPDSPLTTRHSLSKGHRVAAEWIKTKFEGLGCDTVELVPFKEYYGPNVVCTIHGVDTEFNEEQVILGAHLDDRGSLFVPFTRAPGADDDASGSSMLVAVLAALQRSGLRLRRTVKVIAFAGEEQGLIGSRAYARQARNAGDDIVWMLQADMIGYHKPGEPRQCALPAAHATPEANLIVSKIAQMYVPELIVGITRACCSDHQSFYEQGFVSTQVFERNGPIADPYYHNSLDVSKRQGYDFEQIWLLARVALATTVTVAEISS